MQRPTLAAAACLILLPLVATDARGQGEPIELPGGKPYLHEPSGMRFPPDMGTFARASASRFDAAGRNVSVDYRDRGLRVLVSAYVYPARGQALEEHFEAVKRDVLKAYGDARELADGKWVLEQGDQKFEGRRAAFAFSVTIRGEAHEVMSEAYLLKVGVYFIKFRVSCPAANFEAAAARVGRFLQALKLPEPKAEKPVPQ